MRPSILDPLFAPVTTLEGVGPKVAAQFQTLLVGAGETVRVRDLLFHLPTGLIDRRKRAEIATAPEGGIVTLTVRIDRHQTPGRAAKSAPYKVFAQDATGEIALTYFRGQSGWLEKLLPIGETMIVSGRVEWFNGRPSMVHPDFVASVDEAESLSLVEPVYPMTAGLSPKILRKAIGQAVERLPTIREWIDPSIVAKHGFPDFGAALKRLHDPSDERDLAPEGAAFSRLAYDEFLASQLALALSRQRMKKARGRPLTGSGALAARLRATLPFVLTDAQQGVIAEILADMADEDRMLRLLQGDVGAGKTVVALMAMATAAEAGAQSALLAPTEILARQHFDSLSKLCEAVGLKITLLTGRDTGKARAAKLAAIASGEAQIVVGTHALFQEGVEYRDLGLVVVDEQHRFGVHQRLSLTGKGRAADLLVMTATPIPRTLVLAAFGDMDVSRLEGKPAGRKPITTVAVPMERLDEIVDRAGRAMAAGDRLYWVCPLVEESEKSDLMAAEERFRQLKGLFRDMVGLVHGRMSGEEKDAAMAAFKAGRTKLVVATTVIEVGVDVPDASIIVIEHAERFGLSQLHQLRGRVGRGEKASSCVLLYRAPLGETAAARIAVMRETEDGFRIAEEDLKLRGEGDLLGTQQSGMPFFRIASMEHHAHLMEIARDDARLILATDGDLKSERGEALRTLLYLFGKDEAVRLLRSG
ncbi:ATP-dependent DNA helicase RecG [Aurantimonas sp. C2-6-R+9]|uniref:ATP-dependent DNA helicase RecG n=1 Tax=unclassified Aurantimonas TaxID=2638230 RepID=UPI002E197054|nr:MULTISPECIES: ATP-dependent DNA helicase RecG [unclassified Aurantimonas]MEC5290230.1 ATP-dependent DNA helicase RecG [Aurantimonas sp. C2-3-R2]MEC5380341.1 ATP-dependent DNA helicase RecG [Aurantimonas sp. C2-6-R+9]MEC5411294.1 ATP-dependent DNA helicase RecG [Aurantimonas sp. C2-4-R8]